MYQWLLNIHNHSCNLATTKLFGSMSGFGRIGFPPYLVNSAESLSGCPHQVSSEPTEEVTLLQLIVPPTMQEAECCSFAGLLAGLRHMSFMSQVPKLLEDAVIINKGPYQGVEVSGEQSGKTISLCGTVEQSPFRILFWMLWYCRTVVCLR